MTFVLHTNSVSAHQLPLARELVARLGADNFRYVYTDDAKGASQEVSSSEPWITRDASCAETCDVLLTGVRGAVDLMERRVAAGRRTLYMSERWFKPIPVRGGWWLPGVLKLLHPGYFRMAWRFARLLRNPVFSYLPIGPWAAKDMRLIAGAAAARRFIPWGYFVAPSEAPVVPRSPLTPPVKLLCVGRLLSLKRLDTVIRAVKALPPDRYTLTIVGNGPEEGRLKALAAGAPQIVFRPAVPLAEVRAVMRAHDVLVFASNGFEGWGAVVSEALVEGLRVIGSYEAGAPAALLPKDHLFHCGDVKALCRLLKGDITPVSIGEWSASAAALRVVAGLRGIATGNDTPRGPSAHPM